MAIARGPDSRPVLGGRDRRPAGRPADRLGDDGRDRVRALTREGRLERFAAARRTKGPGAVTLAPIGVRRGHTDDVDQPITEVGLVVLAGGGGQGEEGVPVIGRGEGDDLPAARAGRTRPSTAEPA